MSEIKIRAKQIMDSAFGPPKYMGELSMPTLADESAVERLKEAFYALNAIQDDNDNAENQYYLAILAKYGLRRKGENFISHIERALKLDPEFIEAQFALRDGENYLDPFCFPKWEDIVNGVFCLRPAFMHDRDDKCSRVDLIRYNAEILPAILIKAPNSKFRKALSDSIDVRIVRSVDAVGPSMPALFHILAVIFDDIDDPFWKSIYLNLFSISEETMGIEVRHNFDYQPFRGRDTARRFCTNRGKCAVLVYDIYNKLLLAKITEASDSELLNLQEMDAVIKILKESPIDMYVWASSVEIHSKLFEREIDNPAGNKIKVPKWQVDKFTGSIVGPIIAAGDRLVMKDILSITDLSSYGRLNDIFISHAHVDAALAEKVSVWVKNIWPELNVFKTDPQNSSHYEKDRLYFFSELVRSRLVIFLATQNSVDRPMVMAEQGVSMLKPSVTAIAGEVRQRQLEILREGDQFCGISLENVANINNESGWRDLALFIAKTLGLVVRDKLPTIPSLDLGKIEESAGYSSIQNFMVDFVSTIVGATLQTESKAERLLEAIEKEYYRKLAKQQRTEFDLQNFYNLRLPLRARLCCLISAVNDEATIRAILDKFPALVDQELSNELKIMIIGAKRKCDQDEVDKYRFLLAIVEGMLEV